MHEHLVKSIGELHYKVKWIEKKMKKGMNLIPPPHVMDVKGHLPTNWQYFKDSWSNYEIATGLNDKEKAVRVATLLSPVAIS